MNKKPKLKKKPANVRYLTPNEPAPIIKEAVIDSRPMFQRLCIDFLTQECMPLVNNRGNDYGDTIGHNQWLYLKAVAKHLGMDLTIAQCRLFVMAGMADIKYQRMEGGYRVDHVADGINYESTVPVLMIEALQELTNGRRAN